MKRIRYKQFDDIFYASEELLAGSNLIEIALNTKDLEYTILDLVTNEPVQKGKARSLQMLKKKAKQAAKELGVTFEDEVRPGKILNGS